jgi:hypothetical protein
MSQFNTIQSGVFSVNYSKHLMGARHASEAAWGARPKAIQKIGDCYRPLGFSNVKK